jgi:hypothetical protein
MLSAAHSRSQIICSDIVEGSLMGRDQRLHIRFAREQNTYLCNWLSSALRTDQYPTKAGIKLVARFLSFCALRCAARGPAAARKESFFLFTQHLPLHRASAPRKRSGLLSIVPGGTGLSLVLAVSSGAKEFVSPPAGLAMFP